MMLARWSKRCEPVLIVALLALGCDRSDSKHERDASAPVRPAPVSEPIPQLLYLPDGGDEGPAALLPPPGGFVTPPGRCPPEMVDVRGMFCIDRYEVSLVDARQRRPVSPHYHPTRAQTRASFERWQRRRETENRRIARQMPVPAPPEWQLGEDFEPRAVVVRGQLPNGYLNAELAAAACRNAGKRLCRPEEWTTACRGEADQKYPYGDDYEHGRCNVGREAHPAGVLHGNASIHHLDPRLNLIEHAGDPLLRRTGDTPGCASRWGNDAVYDMVGNLDEWVDDPDGAFHGGFFSRATRDGCGARISSHPPQYFDYSLGTRCCL